MIARFDLSRFIIYCALITFALYMTAATAGVPLWLRMLLAIVMGLLAMMASTYYERTPDNGRRN